MTTQAWAQGDMPISAARDALHTVLGSWKKAEAELLVAGREGRITLTCDRSVEEISFGPVHEKRDPRVEVQTVLQVGGPGLLGHTSWVELDNSHQGTRCWYWEQNLLALDSVSCLMKQKKGEEAVIIPTKRWVFYGVKTFVDQVNAIISQLRPQFEVKRIERSGITEHKWARIDDLERLADQGQLGDRFGHPGANGFHKLIVNEIRSRYPEKDEEWPSVATVGRKASSLKKLNAFALARINPPQ